jgi:two-component system response regulator FixJ
VTEAKETLIYVVDDDDAVRDSLSILLESHGMTVKGFSSTQDLVAGFRRHPRACLLLDLHLPVVGGLDFLASDDAKDLEIPTILITGRGDDATRERALELGAVAFLEKPVDDVELMKAIDHALHCGCAAHT